MSRDSAKRSSPKRSASVPMHLDGGSDPRPGQHPGGSAHAGETARMGIPAIARLRRLQGRRRRNWLPVRRPDLRQSELLGERGKRHRHRFQCTNGHQFHSDVNAGREQMLADGAEPTNSGRPRQVRVARRKSPSGEGRCNPPQCSGLADVVQPVSLLEYVFCGLAGVKSPPAFSRGDGYRVPFRAAVPASPACTLCGHRAQAPSRLAVATVFVLDWLRIDVLLGEQGQWMRLGFARK
jgi:hypothetical protein